MYHPDHALLIAHDRERELLKEAEICRLPKTEASNPNRYWAVLAIAMCIAVLAIGLKLAVV